LTWRAPFKLSNFDITADLCQLLADLFESGFIVLTGCFFIRGISGGKVALFFVFLGESSDFSKNLLKFSSMQSENKSNGFNEGLVVR
jgi:hypothetical protein